MIALLRGTVAARGVGTVVVDVAGVGYVARVTHAVPPPGREVQLHTSLQVREDSFTLYGFADEGARDLFELLLTAGGVGPKLAVAALATHPPGALRDALADGDLDALVLIPGIGRKSAQRLVLDLREKVGGISAEPVVAAGVGGSDTRSEVAAALGALGYGAGELRAALAEVGPDDDVQSGLRAALKTLGGGR